MNLRKVLLNIVIQICESTLNKKSAFFFVLFLIISISPSLYSQNEGCNSEKTVNSDFLINDINLKQIPVKTKLYNDGFLSEYGQKSFSKRDLLNEIANFDTMKNKNDTVVKFEMKKNPWKAVLYSAILPGLGQFYNESYWKVPVVVGLGGYLGYIIIKNHGDFLDYRDLYAASQTSQNPNGDLRLKEFREFYRNQRDQFLLYFLFFYAITAVDAYVDANLYDFDVTDYMRLSVFKKTGILNLNIGF